MAPFDALIDITLPVERVRISGFGASWTGFVELQGVEAVLRKRAVLLTYVRKFRARSANKKVDLENSGINLLAKQRPKREEDLASRRETRMKIFAS